MIGSAVGKRYARALYDLGDEQKLGPKFGTDLSAVAEAWTSSDELQSVFANPQFGAESKRAVIGGLADRLRVHAMVKNTLMMLADRGRLAHLPEIAEAYARIAERRSGRVRAEIVTAHKLPEAYYAQLEKTLKEATGKDVVLQRREDPSLIGGVVTTVEGRVFDGSIKHRLEQLRTRLLDATDPATLASPPSAE